MNMNPLLFLFLFVCWMFLACLIMYLPLFLFLNWIESKDWPEKYPFKGMKFINEPLGYCACIVILFISLILALCITAIYTHYVGIPMK